MINEDKSTVKTAVKRNIVMALGMCVFMSVFMSFVMTTVSIGFSEIFVAAWLKGVAIGFCVALPLSFLIPMLMTRVCDKLFCNKRLEL
ncbi:MAG: DUF2798 domain-containing protein [Spirochaetaceae bacterium]|jgi:hypothetical protein|nr:DUF2798 domain-containing protein [Spirochaetaceae bacterium]